MNEVTSINFSDLPHSESGFSELFCDYLNDFQKVQQFYSADFHSISNILDQVEKVRNQYRHRQQITEILLDQNQKFGASEHTLENIRFLGNENTFAIVTGQQVGILGGPLYTIYKTITSVKLAKQLNEIYPQYKFVPVFWLEGEDHDFEEINHINLLNTENLPVKIEYLPGGKQSDKNIGAVGTLILDLNTQFLFEAILKTLQNSDFKTDLIQSLQNIYSPGTSLNKAFACYINKLFENSGLIFISSNDKRVKQLLSPVFLKEINEYPRVSQLIIERSAELERNYHAQIKTKALNLFLFYKDGRYLIEPRESDFTLKGIRYSFSKDELLRIVSETPEMISPNVALRPICQDTLLPTVAYIGGPSEIAYYAQLKSVYQYFGLSMPMIYPRASMTIIEEKIEKIVEKYEMQTMEFFDDINKINKKIVDFVSEVKIDDMFNEAVNRINDLVKEMEYGLNYIDSTLLDPLETTRSKMESALNILREKVTEAQKRKYDIALKQIGKAAGSLYPNGNFQERELNIIYFMNKYGFDFIKFLQNETQVGQFRHQIIRI